jgi:hypothetical protein
MRKVRPGLALLLLVPWVWPAAARAQPAADATRPLGRLEQESVDEAKGALRLSPEPNPEGKIIGNIHVVNQEVFSRRDWYFQLLNVFHRTTRSDVLARELLFKPGQPYNEALIQETMRNLQSPPSLVIGGRRFIPPEQSSVVAILPVASSQPGQVDVLVVTRDIWSLRFNTNFEFQQDTLTFLSTSLSENNLFGWRKFLSMGFVMDQGAMSFGPTYFDPNIKGTRLQLYASTMLYYTRGSHDYEGNREMFSLRYPLFSLASKWGAGLDVTYRDTVQRAFFGNSLALVDLTSTPGAEMIPYAFRYGLTTADANVTRSFGSEVIQRVGFGYLVDRRRSTLVENFSYGTATPAQLAAFLGEYAPISETRSEPFIRYQVFEARYAVYRDLDTFDLRENRQLGPSVSLRLGYGLPALGASFSALSMSGTASFAFGAAGGYSQVEATASARLRDGNLIDQIFSASAYAASPLAWGIARLVLSAQADAARDDTFNTRYFLGGDTGLRGYIIGEFVGTSSLLGHAEIRTVSLPVFSQRFGTLLFYDAGHTAPSFDQIALRHDVGTGLRWLIPQLNASVIRVDWAIPLNDGVVTRAGFPGRVSAGFQQVF